MNATLAACPLGADLRVDLVGAPHATRRRLAELGIRPGARVAARSATAGGGRIVSVSGARIALDRATAAFVEVTELARAASVVSVRAGDPARLSWPLAAR